MTRTIRPSKGGRSAQLPQRPRLRPDSLARLHQVCNALGLSIADWIEMHADDDGARLAMCELQGVPPSPDVVMRGKIAVKPR